MPTDFKYFKHSIKPVLGEVLEGEYKGLKFSMFGKTEIEKYFNYTIVRKIARNKRGTYKNCSFRYISFAEAKLYADKISKELIEKFK